MTSKPLPRQAPPVVSESRLEPVPAPVNDLKDSDRKPSIRVVGEPVRPRDPQYVAPSPERSETRFERANRWGPGYID